MNPVDTAKTVSMVVLGVVSLVLGLLPIAIARRLNWRVGGKEMSFTTKNILSGLLCFGGGVLMATGLTHLLPELHDNVESMKHDEIINTSLHVGEILIGSGFFLVYFIEEVM